MTCGLLVIPLVPRPELWAVMLFVPVLGYGLCGLVCVRFFLIGFLRLGLVVGFDLSEVMWRLKCWLPKLGLWTVWWCVGSCSWDLR